MSFPFDEFSIPDDLDEHSFVVMLDALRDFLGALAHSSPDTAQTDELEQDLRRWTDVLEARRVPDDHAPFGQLVRAPSHALGSLPTIRIDHERPGELTATVTFSRWHVGGGGLVHGGQVGVVLDELMGRTQLLSGWIARTAYLNIDYRAGSPFEHPLTVEVRTSRAEGRKQFLASRLLNGSTVCATAEALFVRVGPFEGDLADLAAEPAPAIRT